jgi:hypothetical protein
MKSTTPGRAKKLADDALKKLEVYCKTGLPDCYTSFEDQLFDFYPDLPWDPVGMKIALEHILEKHEPTLLLVKETFKFDMLADIKLALKEADD